METSRNGALFIAQREALVLVAYQDGPHCSIGFGWNSPHLREGDQTTVPEAFRRLKENLAERDKHLNKVLKVPVAQHAWDALASLHYQSGNRYLPRLVDLINKGQPDKAADLLPECDASLSGTRMSGLRKRREMERKLFLTADYGDLRHVKLWYGDPRKTKPELYEVQPGDI
jgi:GH24 family phage-related lysozyme (muramidase)